MGRVVIAVVQAGQHDEADHAEQGEQDGQHAEPFLEAGRVAGDGAAVAEPALGDEAGREADDAEAAHGDEQRLQAVRGHVRDVRDLLGDVHGREMGRVVLDAPPQQHGEQHGQPDAAGEDGHDDVDARPPRRLGARHGGVVCLGWEMPYGTVLSG